MEGLEKDLATLASEWGAAAAGRSSSLRGAEGTAAGQEGERDAEEEGDGVDVAPIVEAQVLCEGFSELAVAAWWGRRSSSEGEGAEGAAPSLNEGEGRREEAAARGVGTLILSRDVHWMKCEKRILLQTDVRRRGGRVTASTAVEGRQRRGAAHVNLSVHTRAARRCVCRAERNRRRCCGCVCDDRKVMCTRCVRSKGGQA